MIAVREPTASDDCLTVRAFGVAYNSRTVLKDITLTMPARGATIVVGPTGTGKSTLLRTLCGYQRAVPSVRTWGECRYLGHPLGADERWPELVVQHARLLTSTLLENMLFGTPEQFSSSPEQKRDRARRMLEEIGLTEFERSLHEPVLRMPLHVQRLISIARIAVTNAPLLCVDEPTNGVDDDNASIIIDYLRREAERRAILIVLHNQKQMRRLGGSLVLLAGGIVHEAQPSARFFDAPMSEAGRQFVATGSCAEISPTTLPDGSVPEAGADARAVPTTQNVASAAIGPNGFVWLLPGRLAGTPQPGIVFDVDYDLEALRRVGITVLISLTERAPNKPRLEDYGIRSLWYPIPDMEAPTIERAQHVCLQIDQLIAARDVIAVHCKAGLGRTGTILVAYLIWRGASALTALETARRRESRWVQSEAQVRFLEEFSAVMANAIDARCARAC